LEILSQKYLLEKRSNNKGTNWKRENKQYYVKQSLRWPFLTFQIRNAGLFKLQKLRRRNI
jgi:hypothetical protein